MPGGKWPAWLHVGSKVAPLIEKWSVEVRAGERQGAYVFSMSGSSTGADGSGTSEHPFTSDSGRLVIEPEDWNLEYALALAGIEPVPERVTLSFGVRAMFVDQIAPSQRRDFSHEDAVTLAQGLSNAEHVVEVESGPSFPRIRELRVYSPPGERLAVASTRSG